MGEIRLNDSWGEVVGTLDADGTVYEGRSGSWGRTVGRVDDAGVVHSGSGWGSSEVGSVDPEGRVYRSFGFWETEIGLVDQQGCVMVDPGWNQVVGWVEGPRRFAAGAALLLLLR